MLLSDLLEFSFFVCDFFFIFFFTIRVLSRRWYREEGKKKKGKMETGLVSFQSGSKIEIKENEIENDDAFFGFLFSSVFSFLCHDEIADAGIGNQTFFRPLGVVTVHPSERTRFFFF